ncbi:hypothetical protein [Cloacibacterium sp.]|uniref:hypothetical protein n=1 Tax=Cloacibacterium sp. TaxID=1913682 RepID=UPI0039E2A668
MYTIQKIKEEFHLTKAISFIENKGSYTDTLTKEFVDFGGSCDVYIQEFDDEMLQNQVDVFNNFLLNFRNYLSRINSYIFSNLNAFEKDTDNELSFDVIFVPQTNLKYELILVCGKKVKFLFLNRRITLRIEIKNGLIKSIKRTNNSTEDND